MGASRNHEGGPAGRPITVTVRSFASLREVMEAQLSLEVPEGTTAGSLLTLLTGRFPGLGALLFERPGVLRNYVNILRNGRNIAFIGELDTVLSDGDVVALFPPAAGG